MKIFHKKLFWLGLLFFPAAAILLFFPALNRSFASDDFLVLKRIALDHSVLAKGFFRPLSDISLYLNYRASGFCPAGYYLFNILGHGLNSALLFFFCLQWEWTANPPLQKKYAFIAALLFLTYPFHSESIVWVLGRGSVMADTCGIAALWVLLKKSREKISIIWSCFFYFIGLTAYESIIVLPLMVLVILYKPGKNWRQYTYPVGAFMITLLLHLFIRVQVSGVIVGSYGGVFFSQQPLNYAGNICGVLGRLFLPPMQSAGRFIIWFALVFSLSLSATITFFKKYRDDIQRKTYFKMLLLLLIISLLVPFLVGVSTKTSESERLLYFPSVFFCMGVSFLMVNLFARQWSVLLIVSLLIIWNVYLLEKNNQKWNKASAFTKDIVATIKAQDSSKKIVVINLPDELDGAYIFRLGLKEALSIEGVNSKKVVVVNHLRREDINAQPDCITVQNRVGFRFLPPFVTIKTEPSGASFISMDGGHNGLMTDTQTIVLFWDKKSLKLLP